MARYDLSSLEPYERFIILKYSPKREIFDGSYFHRHKFNKNSLKSREEILEIALNTNDSVTKAMAFGALKFLDLHEERNKVKRKNDS